MGAGTGAVIQCICLGTGPSSLQESPGPEQCPPVSKAGLEGLAFEQLSAPGCLPAP